MPYLALPWFAVAGGLAAAGVLIVHMISSRKRAPRPLPTVRFVVRALERSAVFERRPRDIGLLVLRAGALLAAGFALAGPVVPAGEREQVAVVIADLTGAADPAEVMDSARAAAGAQGVVVISGDSVTVIRSSSERLPRGRPVWQPYRASLTAALIEALRRSAELSAGGHRVQLSLASSLTQASIDSATVAVRALWPARIRLLPVGGHPGQPELGSIEVRGGADDPLLAGVRLAPHSTGVPILLVRESLTGDDSAVVRSGRTVVHWPRSALPESFERLATPDTVTGVWMGDYTWIAPIPRSARLLEGERGSARVLARWLDGQAAVVERELGSGCIREVAIQIPDVGDLAISRGFLRLLRVLSEPCGGALPLNPLTESERLQLAGTGDDAALVRSAVIASGDPLLVRILLALALVALGVELVLRQRRA